MKLEIGGLDPGERYSHALIRYAQLPRELVKNHARVCQAKIVNASKDCEMVRLNYRQNEGRLTSSESISVRGRLVIGLEVFENMAGRI